METGSLPLSTGGIRVFLGLSVLFHQSLSLCNRHSDSITITHNKDFPRWLSGKEATCQAGDAGLIPGPGTSPGEGNDNPFQGSCLGNPIEKGAWWATVHGGSQRVGHDSATDQQQPEVSPEKGKNEISQFLLFQHRVGYSGSFGFHMNTISPHSFYS